MKERLQTFINAGRLFFPASIFKERRFQIRGFGILLLLSTDVMVTNALPYATKWIVNALSLNTAFLPLGALLFLFCAFWTLEKITHHIQEILFFPIVNKTIVQLTQKVVDQIHQISLKEYTKLSIPEISSSIRRISLSARSFMKVIFILIIPSFLKFMVTATLIFKTGHAGSGLLLSFVGASIFLYQGMQRYTKARSLAWEMSDKVALYIHDSLLNTKMVRPFKQFERDNLSKLLDKEALAWHRTNNRYHAIYIGMGLLLGATLGGILLSIIRDIQIHTLSVGDFLLIKGQIISAFLPLRTLSHELRQLSESIVDIKKVFTLLDLPRVSLDHAIPSVSPLSTSALSLQSVSFSYDNSRALLHDLSFSIQSGQKIALIGPNGSGKSALINLMGGLLQPTSGTCFLEGTPIQAFSENALHSLLLCIPQDFRLFNRSLKDNLTYGREGIAERDIEGALTTVGLFEKLSHLPEGLNTPVGEMGIKLSGGEKQKIALARALLFKPQILLLDETTHSLNAESEDRILNALFKAIPTVIIVSHHSAVLSKVDTVFKLEQGLLQIVQPASFNSSSDPQ